MTLQRHKNIIKTQKRESLNIHLNNIEQYRTILDNILQYCTILHNIRQYLTRSENIWQYLATLKSSNTTEANLCYPKIFHSIIFFSSYLSIFFYFSHGRVLEELSLLKIHTPFFCDTTSKARGRPIQIWHITWTAPEILNYYFKFICQTPRPICPHISLFLIFLLYQHLSCLALFGRSQSR